MSNLAPLFVVLLAGILLGIFFFGGLWWTVRKGLPSPHAALWFFGSTLLRTGIVLAGFTFMTLGDLTSVFVCLLGFLIGRVAVVHVTRPVKEGTDAP